MRESVFQSRLIETLKQRFPGCVVLKNDSGYIQGIPDLIILYRDRWAALEVKATAYSPEQPNQMYYIEKLNDMSFGAFIYPDNAEEVLNDLQQALGSGR